MTALYHRRTERWPQVSLKEFFVLVTLLCVVVGWLGVQVKWIRDRDDAFKRWSDPWLFGTERGAAPWSIRLLGAPGLESVGVMVVGAEHPSETDQLAKRNAEGLFPEAEVGYVTDTGRLIITGVQRTYRWPQSP